MRAYGRGASTRSNATSTERSERCPHPHPCSTMTAAARCASSACSRIRPSGSGALSLQLERDLVECAPRPLLARLDRAEDRVRRVGRVAGGVAVGRGVTAADLPARPADSQVQPSPAALQALLAARHLGAFGHVRHLDRVEVRARRRRAHRAVAGGLRMASMLVAVPARSDRRPHRSLCPRSNGCRPAPAAQRTAISAPGLCPLTDLHPARACDTRCAYISWRRSSATAAGEWTPARPLTRCGRTARQRKERPR